MVAVREWTGSWWKKERQQYRLVTSAAVFDELQSGNHPLMQEKLDLLNGVSLLDVSMAVAEIAEVYISRRVMPADAAGDALHLALASYHKCDYLLTWNCKHIANANKFAHIRRVNEILRLHTPELVTPLELTSEDI